MKQLAFLVIASSILLPSSCWAQQHVNAQHPVTTTLTHPDGSKEVHRPDGTVITESGGVGHVYRPNGSGDAYLIGPDGQHYQRKACSGGYGPTTCAYSDPIPAR